MAGVESEEGVSGNGKAELGEDVMQMVEDLGGMGRRGRACKCQQRYQRRDDGSGAGGGGQIPQVSGGR